MLPKDKQRFKFCVVMTEHHMTFLAMFFFTFFLLHLKTNKLRDRGVVKGLRNILYCFHSSRCNSLLS